MYSYFKNRHLILKTRIVKNRTLIFKNRIVKNCPLIVKNCHLIVKYHSEKIVQLLLKMSK